VANADTPNYRGRDLKQLDFHEVLKSTSASTGAVKLAATAPGHITGSGVGEATRFATDNRGGFETTPRGNAVVLEDEMMKVAQNQMDHQAATALYSRGLGLLKTALGRK
jgi:flagellar basal-body rod protein FlgB